MRRSWLVSLALVLGLALGVTASAGPHRTARDGQVRGPLGAAAATAARAAIQHALYAETTPVGQASGPVHKIGPFNAVANDIWSGYVADNSKREVYSQVTGTWDEPVIKCTSAETQIALFWVGLDGWINPANTVEQDGSLAECFGRKAFYFTFWETWPDQLQVVVNQQNPPTPVQPRDTIVATVAFNAAVGNFTLTVNDTTTDGNNINVTQPCPIAGACPRQSAEWVAEAPAGERGSYPLPDFTPWMLTAGGATSNPRGSQPIAMFPTDRVTLTAANPWGQQKASYRLITPGPLTPAGDMGNAFIDTWDRSY